MPNNYLSVLYKHIIQVENKIVGLKVCVCVGGHKHTIAPPPPPPPQIKTAKYRVRRPLKYPRLTDKHIVNVCCGAEIE